MQNDTDILKNETPAPPAEKSGEETVKPFEPARPSENGKSEITNNGPQPGQSLSPPPPPPPPVNNPLTTRTGKIARLPHEIREKVNSMLRNSCQHAGIVQKLAELGYPGISVNSISTWKYGGYVDWLLETQHQEKRLTLPAALERSRLALAGAGLQHGAVVFAASALTEIMARFDFAHAVTLLRRRPELFPSFVHSIAALARSSSELSNAFGRFESLDSALREKLGLLVDYKTPSPDAISAAPSPAKNGDPATPHPNCSQNGDRNHSESPPVMLTNNDRH